jgi:hypothetical protein
MGNFLAARSREAVMLAGRAFTWPVVVAGALGLAGLPRRWAMHTFLFIACFAAGTLVVKEEARLIWVACAAAAVLSAGGVLWLGRTVEHLVAGHGQAPGLRATISAALAVALVLSSWALTHTELWGDYAVLRAW